MLNKIIRFYKISAPAAPLETTQKEQTSLYNKLRYQSFFAATLGYSLYYVCRTSLNVVKKPIIESGMLDATQLGIIGAALLFAYAGGKFVNGFLADHSNIRRFMATGLIVSASANFLFGMLGFAYGLIPASALFVIFAALWALNGWTQSMGVAPAIISLSRWFPLARRGTFYGFFSASHNLGEGLTFLFVGLIVGAVGWQWGFFGSAIAGVVGVFVVMLFLHDTPECRGLPSVEELSNEQKKSDTKESTINIQKKVLRTPAVWILAAASAFMYVSRYAVNGWGVLLLQEQKGFSLETATQIISINAVLGILGTVLSGWFSDKLFRGNRNGPALIFGVLNTIALTLFIYGGHALWVNALSMVLFGVAMGVLICFLGGLMAVDIVPRNATGAALGVVGLMSYVAAGIQDVVSGWLIDANVQTINGAQVHDFTQAGIFWIAASAISFILPILNWNKSKK